MRVELASQFLVVINNNYIIIYTGKSVLRSHLWDKKNKWPYKTGDLFKVPINCYMTGQEKGDLLIKLTT